MVSPPIGLIVGLGNPGPTYERTRHNVGQWFLLELARHYRAHFKLESTLQSRVALVNCPDFQGILMIPITYMNCSGEAVQAVARYYKIPPEAVLVVHDELDFEAGTVRIKRAGGHGGHNGLRDIIRHLQSSEFLRFRIGIGRSLSSDQMQDYVLSAPSVADRQAIERAFIDLLSVLPDVLSGREEFAMQELHTKG